MSFVIIVWNSKYLESFLFFICLFVCFCFLCFCFLCFCFFVFYFLFIFCFVFVLFCFVLFFVFVFVEEKTWKVKCYSLPFFLLAICNGKYLHRIEHTKWIKQGQDCQKVIANKSLRIYIYIYLSPLFFQSLIC